MNTVAVPISVPRTMRAVVALASGYLGLSVLSLGIAVVLRGDTALVTTAVWIHGCIVAVTAMLMLAFTLAAAHGSRKAFLRLRIESAVLLIAIVAVVLIPGTFPIWMKSEQIACAIILVAIVSLANGNGLRTAFTRPSPVSTY